MSGYHCSTIRTLVGLRISEDADEPVVINATFVTTLRAIEHHLADRLSLSSGNRGRHSLTFSPDRDNHVALQPECRLVTDGGQWTGDEIEQFAVSIDRLFQQDNMSEG